MISLFFLPKSDQIKEETDKVVLLAVFLIAVIAGVGFGVVFFIPHSMFPEVIEIDELATGERREGLYFSFFVLFQKLGLALSLAISNYVLSLTGFISSTNENPVIVQPESSILALKIMVSFVPFSIYVLSFIPLYFFPINKKTHTETLKLLRERKISESKTEGKEKFEDLSIDEN